MSVNQSEVLAPFYRITRGLRIGISEAIELLVLTVHPLYHLGKKC
jgi:hypothetical protein